MTSSRRCSVPRTSTRATSSTRPSRPTTVSRIPLSAPSAPDTGRPPINLETRIVRKILIVQNQVGGPPIRFRDPFCDIEIRDVRFSRWRLSTMFLPRDAMLRVLSGGKNSGMVLPPFFPPFPSPYLSLSLLPCPSLPSFLPSLRLEVGPP